MYLGFTVGYGPLGQKAYLCYRSVIRLKGWKMKTHDIATDSGDALDREIERLEITLESSPI
jgi:hypothetical protein